MPYKPKSDADIRKEINRLQDKQQGIKRKRYRSTDKAQIKADKLRSSVRWKKVRKLRLINQPFCFDPFRYHKEEGRVVLSVTVHHIVGIKKRIDLAFVTKNLVTLCDECHRTIEAMEKKGVETQHLFKHNI